MTMLARITIAPAITAPMLLTGCANPSQEHTGATQPLPAQWWHAVPADVETGGNRLRQVFDNPLYALAAGLAAPIFDGGQLAAGRDLALARCEELVADYRAAIVAAFGDVEVALDAVAGVTAPMAAQADELAHVQRTLYTEQDAAVAHRLLAAVALYKALGGGWQKPAQPADAGATTLWKPLQ